MAPLCLNQVVQQLEVSAELVSSFHWQCVRTNYCSSFDNVESSIERWEKQCKSCMHQTQVLREDDQYDELMFPIQYHRMLLGIRKTWIAQAPTNSNEWVVFIYPKTDKRVRASCSWKYTDHSSGYCTHLRSFLSKWPLASNFQQRTVHSPASEGRDILEMLGGSGSYSLELAETWISSDW